MTQTVLNEGLSERKMNQPMIRIADFHHARAHRTSVVLLAVLALAACSGSNVKPGESLADAETAVARAERARISDYDAVSWKAARDNLGKARAASGAEETEISSRWFAARAKADAELGIARAERARLAALTMSLKREIETLQAPAGETP